MSDPSGGEVKSDVVQAFDVMQRATRSQKSIGANSVTMASSYDSAGRVYTLTYFPGQGNQRVFRYNYDGAGNLTSLHDDSGGRDLVQYTDFTALGQFRKATFPKPQGTLPLFARPLERGAVAGRRRRPACCRLRREGST